MILTEIYIGAACYVLQNVDLPGLMRNGTFSGKHSNRPDDNKAHFQTGNFVKYSISSTVYLGPICYDSLTHFDPHNGC